MNYGRIALFVCMAAVTSACKAGGTRENLLQAYTAPSGGSTGSGSSGSGSSGGTGTTTGGTGTPTPPPPKVYKNFAYVSGTSGLKSYAISATGALGAITDVAQMGTLSATVDPLGKYVWVIDNNINARLYSYSIAPTTGILALAGSIAIPGKFSYRFQSDPTGTYLFSSNVDSQNVTSYAVDRATGLVALVNSLAVSVSAQTFTDIGVHPTGKYIYVAGSNVVTRIAVAANGTLTSGGTTAITGSSLSFGNSGASLFLYAGGNVYRSDATTGALTLSTASTVPELGAFSNGFVYTAGGNTVTVYSINATTGAVTQRQQVILTNPGGTSPLFKHVSVSPDGTTLYANSDSTGGSGNFVHQLSINATTGLLTDRGIPVQIGGNQLNSTWPIKVEQP